MDGERIQESATGRPAAALAPFVADYTGFRQQGGPPVRHRGLPSPELTLIFTLNDLLHLAEHPDPGQPPGSYHYLLGGLHTRPALITHEGRQSGIQLGLRPLGARALLGLPAGELAGIDLDAADLFGPLAAQIKDRLLAAPDWPSRFAVLDEMLLARIGAVAARRQAPAEIRHAWQQLVRSGGQVSVRELAAATGWSDRHLRSMLRAETGLTPKQAGRVIRFHRARRLLQRRAAAGRPPALADLAAHCGYFDQAHLAREFRELAGCSPSHWLATEFRIVQAAAGGPVAVSLS